MKELKLIPPTDPRVQSAIAPFNNEMLKGKKVIYFEKNTKSICSAIKLFELKYDLLLRQNLKYKISKKYDWDSILVKYLKIFVELKTKIN